MYAIRSYYAVFKLGVPAFSKFKNPLDLFQGLVYALGGGIRPEIKGFVLFNAPHPLDGRIGFIHINAQQRIIFTVFKNNIILRGRITSYNVCYTKLLRSIQHRAVSV